MRGVVASLGGKHATFADTTWILLYRVNMPAVYHGVFFWKNNKNRNTLMRGRHFFLAHHRSEAGTEKGLILYPVYFSEGAKICPLASSCVYSPAIGSHPGHDGNRRGLDATMRARRGGMRCESELLVHAADSSSLLFFGRDNLE